MNRQRNRVVWILLCGSAALPLAAGCGKSSNSVESARALATPSPEASFDVIIATFKRRVETAAGGFIAPKGSGHSRLIASSSVTSQLIPPAKQGDPYRATITVTSKSSYSMRRSEEHLDDLQRSDDQGQHSSGGSLDDPGNISSGVEILDPGLASPVAGDGENRRLPDTSDAVVLRRPSVEEEQIFDLEYRNGRWVLLTNPDPDTQRAIKSAFDEALATQI